MPTHNIGACACCGAPPPPICDPVSFVFSSLTININGSWSLYNGRRQYYYQISMADDVLEITHSDNSVELLSFTAIQDRGGTRIHLGSRTCDPRYDTEINFDGHYTLCNKNMSFIIHMPIPTGDEPQSFTKVLTLADVTCQTLGHW